MENTGKTPVLYQKKREKKGESTPPEQPPEIYINGHADILNGFEPYEDPEEDSAQWKSLILWANEKKGVPDSTSSHNVEIFLGHSPKYKNIFRHDIFQDRILVYRCPPWDNPETFIPRALTHLDIVRCRNALEVDGLKTGKDTVHDNIKNAAYDNKIHPPREYFNRIIWDGFPRLSKWLSYYLGCESQPPEYLAAVGTFWMVAGVARILKPGCKFDHMLVLEGEQGIYKSTALSTLATFHGEEHFTDRITFSKLHDKDTMMMLQGKLIVEFAELANLNNKDFEEIKAWITNRSDEARKPYEREPQTYQRQFILAGTTNNARWLRDPTGNRRFWPVRCGDAIDIEALTKDREQLWAEAAHLFRNKIKFWMDNSDPVWKLAKAEQAIRYDGDIWSDPIADYLRGKKFVRTTEILTDCLKLEAGKHSRLDQMRVTTVLKSSGWIEHQKSDHLNKPIRGWVKKELEGDQKELL